MSRDIMGPGVRADATWAASRSCAARGRTGSASSGGATSSARWWACSAAPSPARRTRPVRRAARKFARKAVRKAARVAETWC
eukprot:scaffold275111_cov36-Tisochrysis_lutea.AAC.1